MECTSCCVENKAVVIKVTGRLDAMSAGDFESECGRCIDQGGQCVILDLLELAYISSAGLRSILVMGKQLKAKGGRLLFGPMSKMVKEVFDISGFATIFPVHASMEKALEAVA
jgi:anti-anti-sigma factor